VDGVFFGNIHSDPTVRGRVDDVVRAARVAAVVPGAGIGAAAIIASPPPLDDVVTSDVFPPAHLPQIGSNGDAAVDIPTGLDVAGMDLRDVPGGGDGEDGPDALVGIFALALRMLIAIVGRGARITQLHWNRLPSWAQGALSAGGVVVGMTLGPELLSGLGAGDPGEDPAPLGVTEGPRVAAIGGPLAHQDPHLIDGHLGAHVVGSWVANGVVFYRLSDGKLAVQNKQGRWKVWKPKKPIVLFADGAGDLRTLLRADAVLTRQAKKIRKMLDARAPRARRTASKAITPVVVHADAHH